MVGKKKRDEKEVCLLWFAYFVSYKFIKDALVELVIGYLWPSNHNWCRQNLKCITVISILM
jgi:hypothetical protein